MSTLEAAAESVSRWLKQQRDDCDGCDDEINRGGGLKTIVTIVTTVTERKRSE